MIYENLTGMIVGMSNWHHNKAPCVFEIILSLWLYIGFQKITIFLLKTNQPMIFNWDQLLPGNVLRHDS